MKAAAPVFRSRRPNSMARPCGGSRWRRNTIRRSNVENPELFPIWPFRLFGLGRPMLKKPATPTSRQS